MSNEKKILILEDEKPMARALQLKLIHDGYDVKAVFNGEEGIKLMEKETFELILLDLIMPKMSGFEVLRILKEKNIKTPVMVLTNLSQPDDELHAKSLGAKEFFVKSDVTIIAIVERVKEFFNSKN